MTLISSGSIPSGGLTVSSITGTYTDLYIYIHSVRFDTDNKYYGMWFNNASGTGKYFYRLNAADSPASPSPDNYIRFSTTKQFTTSTNALGVLVRNYAGTSGPKPVFFSGMSYDGTTNNVMWGGGTTNTNSAIDRFDVQNAPGGGNFSQGSYELWGIK